LNKLYPGLNTAVLGTEFTLTGATNGLDDVLKKREAVRPPPSLPSSSFLAN
jgi:hypothetical protein